MKNKLYRRVISAMAAAIYLIVAAGMAASAENSENFFLGIVPVLNHKSGQSISANASALTDSAAGDGYSGTSWILRSDYHFHNNNYATFTLDENVKANTLCVMSKEVTVSGKKVGIATHFVVEYSDDGAEWKKAGEVDSNKESVCTVNFPDTTAKMWRVQFVFNYATYEEAYVNGAPAEQYRVGEIELFYDSDINLGGNPGDSEDDSENANILSGVVPVLNHKSGQTVNGTASALTDNDAGNGYSESAWVLRSDYHYHNNNYATFTLDKEEQANTVTITSKQMSNYGKMCGIVTHFVIEYSVDGEEWKKAVEVDSNKESVCTVNFSQATAKMWRVQFVFNYSSYEEAFVDNAPVEEYRVGEIELSYSTDVAPSICVNSPEFPHRMTAGESLVINTRIESLKELAALELYEKKTTGKVKVCDGMPGEEGEYTFTISSVEPGDHVFEITAATATRKATSDALSVRAVSEDIINIAALKEVQGDGNGLSYIVDGAFLDEKYTAAGGDEFIIDLDGGFGDVFEVTSINFYKSDVLRNFIIYAFSGGEWTQIASAENAFDMEYVCELADKVITSKIKVVTDEATADYFIDEVEVYGRVYSYEIGNFTSDFNNVNNEEELARLIEAYSPILEILNYDYSDHTALSEIYGIILSEKASLTTVGLFEERLNELISIKEIKDADEDRILDMIEEKIDGLKTVIANAPEEAKEYAAKMLKKHMDATNYDELATQTAGYIALGKIKAGSWTVVLDIVEENQEFLESESYDDYKKLTNSQKTKFAEYIYNRKDSFETKEEFNSLFSSACEAAKKKQTASGGGSSGGGSSGGFGGSSGGGLSGAIKVEPKVSETLVTPPEILYSDVSKDNPYYEAISYLSGKNVISGMGDGSFCPGESLTREQMVKIIVLAYFELDKTATVELSDVDSSRWSYSYIATAYKLGVVSGISDTEFGATDKISYEQLATMLCRVAEIKGHIFDNTLESAENDFSDASSWAVYSLRRLCAEGILSAGINSRESITRGEAAKMVYDVLYQLVENSAA